MDRWKRSVRNMGVKRGLVNPVTITKSLLGISYGCVEIVAGHSPLICSTRPLSSLEEVSKRTTPDEKN